MLRVAEGRTAAGSTRRYREGVWEFDEKYNSCVLKSFGVFERHSPARSRPSKGSFPTSRKRARTTRNWSCFTKTLLPPTTKRTNTRSSARRSNTLVYVGKRCGGSERIG